MLRSLGKFVGFTLLGCLSMVGQTTAVNRPPMAPKAASSSPRIANVQPKASAAAQVAPKRTKKPAAAKAAVAPEPVPIPPMTPEQLPANPPQVSYQNGQLTIQSENATLSDILNAVRRQTGAAIESPPGTSNERVATRLGPGPARDVVASLLNGSQFDYIILGSTEYPGAIQRIIITRKTGPAAPNIAAQGPGSYGAVQNPGNIQNYNPDPDEDEQPDMTDRNPAVPGQPQPLIPPSPGQQPQPQPGQPQQVMPQFPPDQVQPQQGTQPQGSQEPQVKTPEQLLQELQRMQKRLPAK